MARLDTLVHNYTNTVAWPKETRGGRDDWEANWRKSDNSLNPAWIHKSNSLMIDSTTHGTVWRMLSKVRLFRHRIILPYDWSKVDNITFFRKLHRVDTSIPLILLFFSCVSAFCKFLQNARVVFSLLRFSNGQIVHRTIEKRETKSLAELQSLFFPFRMGHNQTNSNIKSAMQHPWSEEHRSRSRCRIEQHSESDSFKVVAILDQNNILVRAAESNTVRSLTASKRMQLQNAMLLGRYHGRASACSWCNGSFRWRSNR